MLYLTDTILARAAASILEAVFDSHALIRVVMTTNPQEYVRELYARVDQDDPIQAAHADIGSALLHIPRIEATHKVISMNIRGRQTLNQEWRKI